MEYTNEQYKRCLNAAALMSGAIEDLQDTPPLDELSWLLFAKRLHEVYKAQQHYRKVLNECFMENYERDKEEE